MNTNIPKVTLFLLCYNQEEFIEESVVSVLSQDYKNLRVVISDDNSSDKTFDIVKSLVKKYKGKAEILLNKNEENLGIGRHFAYIMDNLIDGELVVASAGDDISKSNRVSRIVDVWLKNNKPSLIAHSLEEINEKSEVFIGKWTVQYDIFDHSTHENKTLALKNYFENQAPIPYIGAALAYSTVTYTRYGTPEFYPDYEDNLMYLRALLLNGVVYFPEKLTNYRVHEKSFNLSKIKPELKSLNNDNLNLLDNKNKIKEKYVSTYRFQKLLSQQWVDYTLAIRNEFVNIDYQIVDEIWHRLVTIHLNLIKNKEKIHILNKTLNQFLKFKKNKSPNLEYVKPLKTIIYGADERGKIALKSISDGFEIMAFCDDNKNLHGKKIKSIPIISSFELKKLKNKFDCILIASYEFYTIKKTLVEEIEISENKIVRLPYKIVALEK